MITFTLFCLIAKNSIILLTKTDTNRKRSFLAIRLFFLLAERRIMAVLSIYSNRLIIAHLSREYRIKKEYILLTVLSFYIIAILFLIFL